MFILEHPLLIVDGRSAINTHIHALRYVKSLVEGLVKNGILREESEVR